MNKCKKHPKYKAIRKPKADCQACRDIYDNKQSFKRNYELLKQTCEKDF